MSRKKERKPHPNIWKRNSLVSWEKLKRYKPWPIHQILRFAFLDQPLARKPVAWSVCFFVVFLFSLGPNLAWAGDSTLSDIFSLTWPEETKLPDRLTIRGGYGHVFNATTTVQSNGPAGSGSSP